MDRIRKYNYQINFRVNEAVFMYLHQQDTISEYLNQLINNDRLKRLDKEYINTRIKELETEISNLKELKKKPELENKKIHECVNYYYESFLNNDRLLLTDRENLFWFDKSVLPNLKREGITYYTAQDLLKIFTTNAKNKKVLLPRGDLKNE